MSHGIKVYSVRDQRDMADRRKDLKNMLKDQNYDSRNNGEKIARQVELNFLEMLKEAQTKDNYI